VQPGLLLVRGLLLLSVGLSGRVLILRIAGCWLFVAIITVAACTTSRSEMATIRVPRISLPVPHSLLKAATRSVVLIPNQ
jgi:hypothetical protein